MRQRLYLNLNEKIPVIGIRIKGSGEKMNREKMNREQRRKQMKIEKNKKQKAAIIRDFVNKIDANEDFTYNIWPEGQPVRFNMKKIIMGNELRNAFIKENKGKLLHIERTEEFKHIYMIKEDTHDPKWLFHQSEFRKVN